jgi:cytochrome P450
MLPTDREVERCRHADFASQEYFRNPTAEIEKLRAAGLVVEVRFPLVGTVWTTTTQDLANQVLKDSGTFTLRKDDGDVVGFRWWMPKIVRTVANNMLSADEPDHTRLRSIVDEAFRRQAALEMEPRILAIAGELADGLFAEGSPSDLVDRYARKLPLSVICELLGLPLADRPKFTAWASGFTRFTSAVGVEARCARCWLRAVVAVVTDLWALVEMLVSGPSRPKTVRPVRSRAQSPAARRDG